MLIGAITAAGTASSVAASAEGSPSDVSAVSVPPERIDRAVAALDRLATELMRKTGVPGMAIAVVHNDAVVYAKGFGVRQAGTNERVDANTVFELASVSKSLAATVVAGVVGHGAVKWSEPVEQYFPAFALADPWVSSHVTIGDMFAHRSGLPDHAGDLLEDLGYDRGEVLHRLALQPLAPFRVAYAYTNFGLTAGAEAVARARHTTWEQLSSDVLYKPLGMASTSSRFADYDAAPNKAVLHVRVGTHWVAKYTRDADAQSPAGGASSSVRDLAQWMRLQLANGKYNGRQVIDRTALLEMRHPNLVSNPISSPTARASFYGFGMGVSYDETGRLRLSHSGAFASGAATSYVLLPSEHLGIVVLTNGMPIGVPETLGAEFMDLAELGSIQRDWFAGYTPIFAALFGNPSALSNQTAPTIARPAQPDPAYVGTYANPYYGTAFVRRDGGSLVMELGPHQERFTLAHWDGDVFSYMPRGENAVGISAVTFGKNAAGATTFTVEYLNATKLGTFTRVLGASAAGGF